LSAGNPLGSRDLIKLWHNGSKAAQALENWTLFFLLFLAPEGSPAEITS
jgi:hypothetical protein